MELLPRFLYPLLMIFVMMSIMSFVMIFIIPKFEHIFLGMKLKLPYETEVLIAGSRWVLKYWYVVLLLWLQFLLVANVLMFSSWAKWYCPVLGRLYKMHVRGQFLQTLGLMTETGKPLPEVLEWVVDSGLLPYVVARRADRLAADLQQGQPLAESLARRGLVNATGRALLVTAQKAQNLPWALQELGDSLTRRCARLSYRTAMVLFPLVIFALACLIGLIAWSMFSPLIALIEGNNNARH